MIINSSPLTEAFRVNWLSGTNFEVVTTGKEQLDFETGPNIFELQIYVKDDVGVTDLQVLTVQVTDVNEPPQFQGNLAKGLELYIVEGTKPGFIYQLEALDPEDTSQNIPLSYFLISPPKSFRMSANGTLISTMEFDFEAGNRSYHLLVEVRDSLGLKASTELHVNIVNINDETPRFTSSKRVYRIPEELSPGTIVANITAEDPDDKAFTNILLYSITTVNRYFMINQMTGTIHVAHRLDRDAGELRQHPAITLEVLVKDRPFGGQENRIQITFLVEDINDNPSACTKFTFRPSYVFEVSELSPAQTRIGQVQATDEDFPQTSVVYSISTGGANPQYPNIFWINPQTGELQLVTNVDYETTPIHGLRIQATNSYDTSSVNVTVKILEANDEKPVCTPHSSFLTIPVDLKVGTNIHNFKLTCTDLDSSPRSFRYYIGPGNVNSHFTFSPSAGSNVTRLFLATRFDYPGGLDKIWDYKLLVYITDDNLLSGRKKAEALVETGTVTLSISVIPHPTTIVTTTPGPRITYQILKENVYSPSAWYVTFIITLGSILLLSLLVTLIILVAKAVHRHCPCKPGKHKKPLVKKGGMKNTRREAVLETIQMNTIFDGEAIDPVTGALYVFNSKTGVRKWKDPLTQMPKWKASSPQRAAPSEAVPGEGTWLPWSTGQEGGVLSHRTQAADAGPGFGNQDDKPGIPRN
ncbi:PREDICTED: cadherin-related family member 3 isoform X4 [Condylura cristata]|uniref:cadherin-related family member 3 isoform X4 n=1 Tax=Condylura cristata TaxID=143302 RepID=UPI000643AD8E|nr:PREDICTED: cadherin-related family member 3 isoform X4 [Condylura cristata]